MSREVTIMKEAYLVHYVVEYLLAFAGQATAISPNKAGEIHKVECCRAMADVVGPNPTARSNGA